MTKQHTKQGIVAYPTPSSPFQVWEMDLYGNLPVTPQGYSYMFTAICMFSKYVVAIPIANKDAATVASAIYQLITMFGCFDTMVADHGSEFQSKVTKELCQLLDINIEYSPAFMHHCLGAVERMVFTIIFGTAN